MSDEQTVVHEVDELTQLRAELEKTRKRYSLVLDDPDVASKIQGLETRIAELEAEQTEAQKAAEDEAKKEAERRTRAQRSKEREADKARSELRPTLEKREAATRTYWSAMQAWATEAAEALGPVEIAADEAVVARERLRERAGVAGELDTKAPILSPSTALKELIGRTATEPAPELDDAVISRLRWAVEQLRVYADRERIFMAGVMGPSLATARQRAAEAENRRRELLSRRKR